MTDSEDYNDYFNGRREIEERITSLLNSFESECDNLNYKKGIYLYGSPGSGKTFIITKILKNLNYDIIKYDAGDIRNKSLIETITSNNISNKFDSLSSN